MKKTPQEILEDSFDSNGTIKQLEGKSRDLANSLYSQYSPIAIQAMHTYAEQMAVELAEWLAGQNTIGKEGWRKGIVSSKYLYKLFTQQNQK